MGYTLSFGIKGNYTGTVTMFDDLAGGNLTLCTKDGNLAGASSDLNGYLTVEIGGQTYSLPEKNTPLGFVSAARSGNGFKIVFTQDDTPGGNNAIPVVVRYYAKVTGETAKISNQVTLSSASGQIGSAGQDVMRSSQSSLFLEKAILQNGKEENIIKLDPGQESVTVTFRIKMTQFSDELSALESGKVIVVDVLNPKFTYKDNVRISGPEAGVDYGGYFNVNHNAGGRTVTITKANSEKLKAGEYNVDFDVELKPSDVKPGEVVTNTVNKSTVYIYRDAELKVEKTWLHWEDNKDKIAGGATIGLFTDKSGGTQVGDTIMVHGNNAVETGTIKFNADDLGGNGGTYWLREVVPYEN